MDRAAPDTRGLRWKCRRGMLELDVLLGRFLDTDFPGLDPAERQSFERLLEQEDDVLWDWLSGKDSPEEQGIARLVDRIRALR